MKAYERLLLENKAWAKEKVFEDPEYFERLVNVQTPEFLWIGCSDSRVPPNEITQTHPGEIFIHRNIANMVVHTDLNMLSVLQYAVEVLKVKHIIVCGHYNCGGVKAAMTHSSLGLINKWLRNIKDVYRFNQQELDQIENYDDRINRLIELNVKEQVLNIAKTSIVQQAWKNRHAPHLHGWVYDLHDGLIKPVFEMAAGSALDHPIYEFQWDDQAH
ncbi:MAG: carbonic anhydrase [Chitinophagales bacterium]|nr:carbonic anhydrase [Chitinophagales bacterium]